MLNKIYIYGVKEEWYQVKIIRKIFLDITFLTYPFYIVIIERFLRCFTNILRKI